MCFRPPTKTANHDFYSVALCFLKTELAYLFCTIRLNGGTPEPHLSVFLKFTTIQKYHDTTTHLTILPRIENLTVRPIIIYLIATLHQKRRVYMNSVSNQRLKSVAPVATAATTEEFPMRPRTHPQSMHGQNSPQGKSPIPSLASTSRQK